MSAPALPAAVMLTMLPLRVGMEWVLGVMAPTTPIASRAMVRWVLIPIGAAMPKSVVHW